MKHRPKEHQDAQRIGKQQENNICIICGQQTDSAQGHHIIFYSEGGPADTQNITAMCKRCHDLYHQGKLNVDIDRF